MSQAANGHNDHAGRKEEQEKNSAANPENGGAPGKDVAREPKSKSYAEILKGFEEIEKIFKQDRDKTDK